MEIHLDLLGGWSGDMFVAALLDAFPEHWEAVESAVSALGLGEGGACRIVAHRDSGGLTGRRFLVAAEEDASGSRHDAHDDDVRHDDHHHDASHRHGPRPIHAHRRWASIRSLLADGRLDPRVSQEAIAIFSLLADAEGAVHGVPPGDVAFHEVGATDSIVDVVAAAQLIALIDAGRWTASPLPLGSGRVRTAHGLLPVPAPATALLLRGLDTVDDGIAGERVTPTGAALARHLLRDSAASHAIPRRLVRIGTGFGTRELTGISNCLRALAFEPAEAPDTPGGSLFAHRELGVVTFEVDDQSAEDLAAGLDHVRAMSGVHDVIQSAVFGKKGRLATQVQVLVAPERLDDAIKLCFAETTTIGLRFSIVRGAALPRELGVVRSGSRELRIKSVRRPDGSRTAKAETADVAGEHGYAERTRLRREAEALALAGNDDEDGWHGR